MKDKISLYLCKSWKKKRKPNFTARELTIITENVEANKGILQSKFTDNVTNKTKTETWKAITEKVNAVGVASRTIYKLKQKWKGLFSTAKKEFSQQKKVQRKMGGGPPPGEPSKTSKMIVKVYDNMPGFSGITGGFESGQCRCDHYLHEGTKTVTENLWETILKHFNLSHVTIRPGHPLT